MGEAWNEYLFTALRIGVLITFIANVLVKHWQRWLRHSGGSTDTKGHTTWGFVGACTRELLSSISAASTQDTVKHKNLNKVLARLILRLNGLSMNLEKWLVLWDNLDPDDHTTVVGFVRLHLSCIVFSTFEVLLCMLSKTALYGYAIVRMFFSSEKRHFEKARRLKWEEASQYMSKEAESRFRIIFVRHG